MAKKTKEEETLKVVLQSHAHVVAYLRLERLTKGLDSTNASLYTEIQSLFPIFGNGDCLCYYLGRGKDVDTVQFGRNTTHPRLIRGISIVFLLFWEVKSVVNRHGIRHENRNRIVNRFRGHKNRLCDAQSIVDIRGIHLRYEVV